MTSFYANSNLDKQRSDTDRREKTYESLKQSKGVFFPSNKKLYEVSMHQNSEEFKQLGTIHMENRAAEYYPLDKPQPGSNILTPIAIAAMKATGSKAAAGHSRAHSFSAARTATDPEKSRSTHVKNLVADRVKEEELRQKIITDEIVKMKYSGPRASSA